ncbi:unnamed protein product [Amoebophrya sp. A25]|nr:unnamed protein product [Amoebophrya sp. A25]|eukprot:GSA25T00019099001.1
MMKIHPDQVQVGGSSSSSSSCTALAATSYIAEIIAPPAPLNGEEPSSSEGVVWHQNDQNIFNHNDVLSSHGALPDDSTAATRMKLNYAIIYSSAALGFYALWYTFHDIGLSTLLTFSVLIQSVALICLLAGVLCQRSVRGISAMSIGMQACSFCLRLGTTTFLRGYIPTDSTGDYLYQLADLFALTLCVYIVYLAKVRFAHTYQRQADSFPVAPTLVGCIIAAIMIHPDLNNCPFFDALWAASLYTDVMSTMPQLWMINRLAGKFDALSAHYVFLVALSRVPRLHGARPREWSGPEYQWICSSWR